MKRYDLIIIGGGASGCFAAYTAAKQGLSTLIIERGRLMQKLGITGKGRCNLTNNCGTEEVIKNLPTNGRFMYSALDLFSPSDTITVFEQSLGVPLKTERGGRVFPQSDKATDIVNSLRTALNEFGVDIIYDRICKIIIENNIATGAWGEKSKYLGSAVLLATGGMSYSKTGSTGDGYKMAENSGHSITPLKASLVPVLTVEDCSETAGLTLKNIVLKLFKKTSEKPLFNEQGEMLFTHTGISGPLTLSASAYIKLPEKYEYYIELDLKPALSIKQLDLRLLREFDELKNKEIGNAMRRLLPESIIPVFLKQCGIEPSRRVNEITRVQRQTITETLKSFRLTVKALADIEQAVITDGGINVKEINPKTMESKIIKSLYFAGEIIDVAGFTGGFNLQAAFSTAYTAATAIINRKESCDYGEFA